MKVSTRARYALKALIFIGLNAKKKYVTVKEISKSQKISFKYLEHIMKMLLSYGIVTSLKGKGGGFMLAEEASVISAARIIKASEGNLDLVERATGKSKNIVDTGVGKFWDGLSDNLIAYLDKISLQDIIDMCSEKAQPAEKNPVGQAPGTGVQ